MSRTLSFRLIVTALVTVLITTLAGPPSVGAPPDRPPGSYANPLMADIAQAFSDVGLIRAKDGAWYAYATNTSLTKANAEAGGPPHLLPMVRSTDLVNWEFLGDAFSEANHPQWAGWPNKGYWAPDVRYVDGQYYMYYSAPGSTALDAAIGLATAPTPAGPWTDIGHPVVNFVADSEVMEIDPMMFIDDDGTKYLYYGSFRRGGLHVVKLSADGRTTVGQSHQVVAGERGEAAWVTKRGPWYYLFYSGYGCCMGDVGGGGYPVLAGRSTSPTGPFLDANGVSLAAKEPGGTIVNSFNGNTLAATGHNAVTVDRSGQQWNLVNSDFRFEVPYGGRPQSMDRLDWIDDWPTVRAGQWTSDRAQQAPATAWHSGSSFNDSSDLSEWSSVGSNWTVGQDSASGGYVASDGSASMLLSRPGGPADYRAEADLRSAAGKAGLVFGYHSPKTYAVAWLDPVRNSLRVEQRVGGKVVGTAETPLYQGFRFDTWHTASVEVRGDRATVQVAPAAGDNPLGELTVRLADGVTGAAQVGVAGEGGVVHGDNVGKAQLYKPVTQKIADPQIGQQLPDFSDDFADGSLDAAWQWTGSQQGQLENGKLVWNTQAQNLSNESNLATVLLRDAPEGDYTVETRLSLPFDGSTGNARAGLIAWASRKQSLQLAPTRTGAVRQAFLWPGADASPWPEAIQLGPSADTMWLRLRHTTQPDTGEHLFQAATSLDGKKWEWGSYWYLPTDAGPLKLGLISMGGTGTTARFDYVRTYQS
ncbi:glycosyl hydrolase family 43 [Kribbella amoyensis]|uniref:Glycosyl hydrolase family 43 n=1 Tax=Kribbella amoyensis TaxID=996641 RepID=A0A561BYZ5_9ACTN|nr:family 43 glycosylhydrolase [Kribbella amoyensis]TWD84047.1 glycosyl hydrolase family 43 [Kribbella amoyensis]